MRPIKETRTTKHVSFAFDVRKDDFIAGADDPMHEQNGVVAHAFKRNFPNEKFVRAHYDYYIGLERNGDTDRYLFDESSTHKIHQLQDSDPDTFETIRLECYRVWEMKK